MISSSSSHTGVPDGRPKPAAVLPGQVRRRAAEVDTLAVRRPRGEHHRRAAQAGLGAALPARQVAARCVDVDPRPAVRRANHPHQLSNMSVC